MPASNSEREIFAAAAAMTLADRPAYLDTACGGNAELRARVEAWLRTHDADSFMEAGAGAPEIEANLARHKPEEVGERIGPYKLMEQIGQGGFGTVWVADQEKPVRRRVALKIIKLGMDTKEVIARFEQERQALAMMEHPHIAKVLDAGATQWGRPYFVMELVRGIKITDYCDQANLPTADRLALFIQVCNAVQHAHQKGIIHRDLKPSNILVTLHDGVPVPKVIDFGVAKATQQTRLTDLTIYTQFQQMIGTPLYMSPEQAEMSGLDIDTRSDIYSLGVLLYELLTGRTPFDPEELMKQGLDEIRRTIREQEPQTPSAFVGTMAGELRMRTAQHRQTESAKLVTLLRGDLDWIVMKALEKDRARRYETANGLALDIKRHLASEPVLARPASQLYRFQRTVRRNRLAFAAGTAVALALLAGLAGSAFQWRRAEVAGRATRERLAHEHIRAGLRMAETGDTLRGLPHYVEALRLGLGDAARERVERLRFEMTMRQAPRLAQFWLPEQDGEMQFAEKSGRVVFHDGADTRVWDAATGAAVSPPMHESSEMRFLWTDPHGTRVVTSTRDNRIHVWDSATGTVLAHFLGEGHVRAVLGGPRLRMAIRPTDPRVVLCFSALDGAADATFSQDEIILWTVASPDGARVLAATKHSLLLWDVASRALVVPPVEFGGEPDFGNFDPSGRLAGLRVKHEDGIAVFDLTIGAITARGATKSIGSIRHGWLDGTRWVVLSRKSVGSALREGATDRLLFDAPIGGGTVAADFAAGCNVFALVGENGVAQVWDADAAQPLTPRLWGGGRPSRVRLSADGATFLTSSSEPAVRLWKLPAQGGAEWSATATATVLAAWWEGGRLLTADADARLTARDAATGRPLSEARVFQEAATCAAPDAAGRLVLIGSVHSARLWNAVNGEPAGPLIECGDGVRDVALSADGRRAAVLLEKKAALLCDPATGAIKHTLPHEGALRCLLGADGARLVTIARDSVRLWDAATGEPVGNPLVEGEKWRDADACFDRTGQRLAVWWSWPQGLPGRVRVLEAATGREMLPRLEHATAVRHAAFSAAGDLLATGTRDQRLWVWHLADGRPALAPIAHDDRINGVGFSPDGLLVWSRSSRVLRTWETATGDAAAPALRHRGPPPPAPRRTATGSVITDDDEEVKIAWSAQDRVATSDSRGGVNVWDFTATARPLEEMESLARVLSMHRIAPGGGLVPLTHEELRAAWAAVHR